MYKKRSLYLTTNQLAKIRAANGANRAVTIRVESTPLRDSSKRVKVDMYLTDTQIKKIRSGKPVDITLSKTQLKKNGGFVFSIPAILAGLGAAAGMASSAATIAKAVNSKKHEKRMENMAKTHNKKLENLLRGKGIFLPGKRLLLKK